MRTSNKGIELIKKYEGFSLKAYQCPAGVWTVGYGHTKGVKPWTVVTKAQAEQCLREDVLAAERSIDQLRYLQQELKQCHYDALVSFTFNLGVGAFNQSSLRKLIIQDTGNPLIRNEFQRWVYVNGRISPGLVARRREEADLYFSSK